MPRWHGSNGSWYDTALVCLHGHMVNSASTEFPEQNRKRCQKCGAETITKCRECDSNIRGYHFVPGFLGVYETPVPAYCEDCGKPYPWTEYRIEALRELAEEFEIFDVSDRAILEQSIEELIRDTPKAPAAAIRFRNIASKGGAVCMEGFKQIIFNLLSEPVRKLIWS